MKKFTFLISLLFVCATHVNANQVAVLETNFGNLEIKLYEKKAPISVANFKNYINSGFYKGTIFHRVIDNFMIQGGGYTANLKEKVTKAPIKNEADNGLSNILGTVSMARTSVVDSATSQFFINVKDNKFLDHTGKSPSKYGYTVFGKVISGMAVINRIKKQQTGRNGPHQNLPNKNIVITKAYLK